MNFALADVVDWIEQLSCTPTALAAITGKTPTEIGIVLKKAAEINGHEISNALRPNYNINDWLKAIRLVGGQWVPGDNFEEESFNLRPTINDWLGGSIGADLELVFCDDGVDIGHVFATIDRDVVDTYTRGKRVAFSSVPASYEGLRVKRTFLIF